MVNKINEHKNETASLITEVSSVFVVKNAKRRAFIEQFEYTSVNFTQKDLGTILGFFIVRDQSYNSENIVNFLASEIKKHYFAPNQKTAEEKFESTLHRINRALEELATLDNVEWLGTIDSAVCVISDASIHFSVTGDAYILLLRDNTLLDISEGLASPEAKEYPLKTFVDISSGDIRGGDKIIITSKELLDLIPPDELEKNANRMGQDNFIQLIETALTNECTIASTTIIDIYEKKTVQTTITVDDTNSLPDNFFSAQAFTDTTATTDLPQEISTKDLINELPKDYTDPRTGHIHIHGSDIPAEKPSVFIETKEKIADIGDDTKAFLRKNFRSLSKKFTRKRHIEQSPPDEIGSVLPDIPSQHHTEIDTSQKIPRDMSLHFQRVCVITKKTAHSTVIHCVGLLSKARDLHKTLITRKTHPQEPITYVPGETTQTFSLSRFLPRFTYSKELWRSMTPQKRLIALSIIVFIIIVPFFFSMYSRPSHTTVPQVVDTSTPEQNDLPDPDPPQKQETRNTIPDPIQAYASNDLSRVFFLSDSTLAIDNTSIHLVGDDNGPFTLPADAGDIALATPMADLNLLFIITTANKIFTFSPLTRDITQQNNIPAIDHTAIQAIGTYLTYLYTLSDNTVTRYTRIDNGFDAGKAWLKESATFTNISDMAINADIFIVDGNNVTKYFQGAKVAYQKDPSIIAPQLVYATDDIDFVWILDTTNATLYKTDKESSTIIDSYRHEDLSNATSFAISDNAQQALITSSTGILTFSLE